MKQLPNLAKQLWCQTIWKGLLQLHSWKSWLRRRNESTNGMMKTSWKVCFWDLSQLEHTNLSDCKTFYPSLLCQLWKIGLDILDVNLEFKMMFWKSWKTKLNQNHLHCQSLLPSRLMKWRFQDVMSMINHQTEFLGLTKNFSLSWQGEFAKIGSNQCSSTLINQWSWIFYFASSSAWKQMVFKFGLSILT